MKTITIPKSFGYPTVDVVINNMRHTLKSGEEITIDDYIAEVIENAMVLAPKYGRNLTRLAQLAEGSITELDKGDLEGVKGIYQFAFYNCDRFQSVAIPNSVKSIGYSAFRFCGSLKKVEIPESVLNIDERAFDNCISLVRVIVKASKPPIIQSETFANIPASCVFEVPSESVEAYKSATYWSNMASRIVAIEE